MTEKTEPKEFYDFNDDAIDNFDKLNDVYRESYDWIKEDLTNNDKNIEIDSENIQLKESYNKLTLLPNEKLNKQNNLIYETEYKKLTTDPSQRLLALKQELKLCQEQIDDYSEKFQKNSFKINEGVENTYNDIKLYKSKVDAFIDYNIYKEIKEGDNSSSNNDNNDNSKSNDNSNNNSNMQATTYQNLYDRQKNLSNLIISQVKDIETNLLNNNSDDRCVKYEIFSCAENQIETLNNKLSDLDTKISSLEKNIGDWSLLENNESIAMTLNKLLSFVQNKMSSDNSYEKKYQISKDCGNLVNSFVEKSKDKILVGSYYLKIKELYSLLEQCESFDHMFEYIKKRLSVIKHIHQESDKFNLVLDNLTKSILSTEVKYKKLLKVYEDTLNNLEEFEKVMEEMRGLDKEMYEYLI